MCVAKHASALVVCGKRRTRKIIVLSATDRQKSINTLDKRGNLVMKAGRKEKLSRLIKGGGLCLCLRLARTLAAEMGEEEGEGVGIAFF